MKTTELVRRMRYEESEEVKKSNGGDRNFRAIMNWLLHDDKARGFIRDGGDIVDVENLSNEQIAQRLEEDFTKEEINAAKNVYINQDGGR